MSSILDKQISLMDRWLNSYWLVQAQLAGSVVYILCAMPAHSIRHKTYPLLEAGLSTSEVCRQSGAEKGTVLRHARELNLIAQERLTPRYDWTEVQKDYDAGVTPTRCMEKHHFSSSAWTRAIQTGKIVPDPARQRKRGCMIDEDITGTRYGKLVVIKQVESQNHQRRWLCKCDCGNEKIWATGALNWGSSQSCGCAKNRKGEDNHRWTGYKEISGGYWANLQTGAIRHGRVIPFELTIEQAWNLFQQQKGRCIISGVEIVLTGRRGHQTASLDRIDSSKGYTLDNVQWVHKDVNYMKLDHSMEEFLTWISLIYHHQHEHTGQADRHEA